MSVCKFLLTSLGLFGGFRLLPSGDQVCLVVCGQEFVSLRQTEYRYGNMEHDWPDLVHHSTSNCHGRFG